VSVIRMTRRKTLKGAHDIGLGADKLWEDMVPGAACDCVFLPGGGPNSKSLREDVRVLEYLKKAFGAGKYIAAICAAPTALERAGIIRGRNVTSYPGCLDENSTDYNYSKDPVVTDGKLVTGRGAGCAFLFGLTLVRELFGESKALELAEGTIYPHANSLK
jgi:4-methyl-5(b-hydroxyethyl)-thiazole monophosphate biosynthesis